VAVASAGPYASLRLIPDNHANIPPLSFLQAGCPSCHPTNSVKALKENHTTGSRNIKLEVVFKVQKMARYASFCLKMDPFKGEVPIFARLWPVWLP